MNYVRKFFALKGSGTSSGRAIAERRNSVSKILLNLQRLKSGTYKAYVFGENTFFSREITVNNMGRCDISFELDNIKTDDIKTVCILSSNNTPILTAYTSGTFNWQRLLTSPKEEIIAADTETAQKENPDNITRENTEENTENTCDDIPKQDTNITENTDTSLASDASREEEAKQEIREIINNFDKQLKELEAPPFDSEDCKWERSNLIGLKKTDKLWKYANNPFIVYACRHHGHIYIGHEDNNCILAVPWIYCKNYVLEGQLQGFREFRPLKGEKIKEGTLCYCILRE